MKPFPSLNPANSFENRDPKEVWAEIRAKGRFMSDEEKHRELKELKQKLGAK